jgi:hypothetical protein
MGSHIYYVYTERAARGKAPGMKEVDFQEHGGDVTEAATGSSSGLHPSWWQWPTVLSLDAPAISVVWLVFLARALRVDLGWPPIVVLGASVWLAYAADRSIEGWRLPREDVRTPRHAFYQRWRGPVSVVWGVVCACDLAVAVARLPRPQLLAGAALTAAVASYLFSHQLVHRQRRWRVPKEMCISGLLASGAAVFLVEAARASAMALPLALFAGVCFVNCALISAWERDVDRVHQQSSLALESRHAPWIPWTPWILAVAALSLAIAGGGASRPIAGCVAASASVMGVVDRLEPRFGWPLARVLADGALFTPLIALWFVA